MNVVQEMIDQVVNLQNKIEQAQESCSHINRICDGESPSGEPKGDVFSDPFADPFAEGFDYEVKENGTIIECHCPDCLKIWMEIRV